MPVRIRTTSATARSVWLRRIDPSMSAPSPGWRNTELSAIGNAAARETFTTATAHMASIWTDLFESMLSFGPQLRWRGDGPGIGRDARTAYSSLLGRYMARAYLTEFEGVRVLVPLDVAKRWLVRTRFEIRKHPRGSGLEADWVGLDDHGLVIVEAKGTHNNAKAAWAGPFGIPSVIETAIGQATRTAVFRRWPNRKLPSKRWAIASRWGTEDNARDPTLIAWDPDEGELDKDDYKELERILLRADLQGVASGMGYSQRADALVGELAVDDADGIGLRVGDRLVETGLVTAVGPFGILPVRGGDELSRIRQIRELTPSLAMASLSTRYIRSIRGGAKADERPMVSKGRSASQGGLTIIWPDESEDIDFYMTGD